MSLSRRNFLKVALGTGLLFSSLSSRGVTNSKFSQQMVLYSAAMDPQGNYFVVAVSDQGELIFKTPLPARAHSMLIRPEHKEILVFSRRPGYFLQVLNARTGTLISEIEIKNNRPLCGHGVFSQNGSKLYLTANAIDQQHGVIQVLDANNHYRQINEFSSAGIGPHEIGLLADGKTLVVANGGILTHPNSGRSKLNLESMTPALSYLDAEQGKLLADYRLEKQYHQLSIRHLAINKEDTVFFAMQYQGARQHRLPLVGFHHQGQSSLKFSKISSDILSKMKNYCGSVCVDSSGKHFAVSSPRGNLITFWKDNGEYFSSQTLNDGCGIATGATENSFYLSSGGGEIHHYQGKNQSDSLIRFFKNYRWDNHLLSQLI